MAAALRAAGRHQMEPGNNGLAIRCGIEQEAGDPCLRDSPGDSVRIWCTDFRVPHVGIVAIDFVAYKILQCR